MIKELNYAWTQDDIKKYGEDLLTIQKDLKSSVKNNFCLKSFMLKLAIIIVVACIFGVIFSIAHFFGNKVMLCALLVIIVLSFIASKKGSFVIPLHISKKVQQTNQSLTINSDSSDVLTNNSDAKTTVAFNWSKIQKIYNTENNILLFVTRYNAYIIPKRIFNSEEEMNETWNLIQECFDKSR